LLAQHRKLNAAAAATHRSHAGSNRSLPLTAADSSSPIRFTAYYADFADGFIRAIRAIRGLTRPV
jgi:hypothetical protein